MQKFGAILDLVPRAESVIKLHAVCMRCFHSAAYTKRISNECEVGERRTRGGGGLGVDE